MTKEKQINRSKKWIIDALLHLMKSNDYSSITITEICQEADIVRRTFYRYFKTKEEVLSNYINQLYRKYLEECCNAPDGASITYNYFKFWLKHKDFLMMLSQQRLLTMIMLNYDEFLTHINEKYFENLKDCYNEVDVEYYCLFIAGGLWTILLKWIGTGGVETPEQMAEKVKSMLKFKISSNKQS